MTAPYGKSEMMSAAASRQLRDGECVFVGIGLPNVACNLAKRMHAPGLLMIYEAGVYGAAPERQPLSIGDPCLVTGAAAVCSMADIFTLYLQRGNVDVGVLGSAQVDRFGNINTTVVGEYAHPKVRLPGSGGACEIALLAGATLVITPLSKRAFPERVDFITSPGFLAGGGERERLGIRGGGPRAVVTNRCVFGFVDGEMTLSALYPGVTLEQVRAEIPWNLRVADDLHTIDPPSELELRIIRELDPQGLHVRG